MEPASGSVKKLDKKALEGLDARDEDMEDLVEGPPSDNEKATSIKRSQSKPEHARGPLRESKQAKKALVHKGILIEEEAESLSAEQVMDMVKKYRKGNSMLSEVVMQQLEENKKKDLLAKLFGEHVKTADMKVPDHGPAGPGGRQGASRHTRKKKVLGNLHVQTPQHRTYMK